MKAAAKETRLQKQCFRIIKREAKDACQVAQQLETDM
jgi:hypothetical protein